MSKKNKKSQKNFEMSDLQFQLLSQKIDNVFSSLSTRIDQIDENKTVKAENIKLNETIDRLTTSNIDKDTIIQNLQSEIEEYKQKENKTNLIQANSALKGADFEDNMQSIVTNLCKYDGNITSRTSQTHHSGDNIVIFQGFKTVIDWKNRKPDYKKRDQSLSCDIQNDDVKKIMEDAQNVDAHAAILVYPELSKYNGFCDFMYNEPGKGAPDKFDKKMVIACTPERIYEAFPTLISRYMNAQPKIKTITEENTIITQNLSKLCHLLMKTVRPICEAFGTTDKKNTMNDWGKEVGKLILNLQNECSDRSDCDANLIALKKEVREIFDVLSIRKAWPNVFGQKRKLECDEDVSHKKTKVDAEFETGQTPNKMTNNTTISQSK